MRIAPVANVPLAPLTTLELGGPARFYVEASDEAQVVECVRWADEHELPLFVLGGGSNLVVADRGFGGLVLRLTTRGMAFRDQGSRTLVEVQAGEPWDNVVAASVERDLVGIESLSGIPGQSGSAPVQNIGAYGYELSSALHAVRVLDRRTLEIGELPASACGLAYRDSLFKHDSDRFVVLGMVLSLAREAPTIRYDELARAVGDTRPTVAQVRAAVLALRRRKSMVWDANDPNRRSAGSFFMNPMVSGSQAASVAEQARGQGLMRTHESMPSYPLADGRVKLAAGWLIERAGIARGFRMGPVGISDRHALALVHHGGGTTDQLLQLARHVRDTVASRFAVTLVPEPVFLGTTWASP